MAAASKSTFVLGHRHLLGIEGLSAADITGLLDLSEEYVELNRQAEKKVNTSLTLRVPEGVRGRHLWRDPADGLTADSRTWRMKR